MRVPVRTSPSFAQTGNAETQLDAPALVAFSASYSGDFSAVQAGDVTFTDRAVEFNTSIVWLKNWSNRLKKAFDR